MGLIEHCPKLTDLKMELKRQNVEGHWFDSATTAQAKYEAMKVTEKNVLSGRGGHSRHVTFTTFYR